MEDWRGVERADCEREVVLFEAGIDGGHKRRGCDEVLAADGEVMARAGDKLGPWKP